MYLKIFNDVKLKMFKPLFAIISNTSFKHQASAVLIKILAFFFRHLLSFNKHGYPGEYVIL